jgi:uncharacterized membrane protein YagU involved in acid resistance
MPDAASIKGGLTAGFVATVVLSVLMIGKAASGLMSNLNPIADMVHLGSMLAGTDVPPVFGWVCHFLIGTIVWGIAYALLVRHLPGPPVVQGLIFGVIAWLAMMIVFMPLVGHALFGLDLGMPAVVITLILHVVYGGVLGTVYPHVSRRPERAEIWPAE